VVLGIPFGQTQTGQFQYIVSVFSFVDFLLEVGNEEEFSNDAAERCAGAGEYSVDDICCYVHG
jgi:hypothetical protein